MREVVRVELFKGPVGSASSPWTMGECVHAVSINRGACSVCIHTGLLIVSQLHSTWGISVLGVFRPRPIMLGEGLSL